MKHFIKHRVLSVVMLSVLTAIPYYASCADLLMNLGPEEFVQAGAPPTEIVVSGRSIPSYVDWNNNGRYDLLIGEGGDGSIGLVRVYLNSGTRSAPQFGDYFYAQAGGENLSCPAYDGLGCFPRVVYWDRNAFKDLLVGQGDGTIRIFLNTGSDLDPVFNAGSTVQVGYPYNSENLDVGSSAAPWFVDWDSDGRKDIIAGAADGKIHIYLNCGCISSIPAFYHSSPAGEFVLRSGTPLIVPEGNSSPMILDLDNDFKKDILTGNGAGNVTFFSNIGTNIAPRFSDSMLVESEGVPIELGAGFQSVPFACDWTNDGYLDLLVGGVDGKVRLFQGGPVAPDLDGDLDVDGVDLALFASAWRTRAGDPNWNPMCDISEPSDGIINELDLWVLARDWLTCLQW